MTKLVVDVKSDLDDILRNTMKAVDRLINYNTKTVDQNTVR